MSEMHMGGAGMAWALGRSRAQGGREREEKVGLGPDGPRENKIDFSPKKKDGLWPREN